MKRTSYILLVCGLLIQNSCVSPDQRSPDEIQTRINRKVFEAEQKAREQAERSDREAKRRTDGWLAGKLTCLADGTVLPLRVEKVWAFGGSSSGGITATHPKTGETLNGRYTAIRQGDRSGTATVTSTFGQPIGTAQVHEKGRNSAAVATLTGNLGTIIQVQMQIISGWSPHGVGTGNDNKGNQYQLEF